MLSRSALLDVNVLVALFNEASRPITTSRTIGSPITADAAGRACPITENGLLRVLEQSEPRSAFSPVHQLAEHLRRFCARRRMSSGPTTCRSATSTASTSPRFTAISQMTDVYLLGLAVKRGGRFVTFDQKVPLAAVKGATRASLEVIAAAE